jgi:Holliday junction DNA helicase RuvA
MIGYLLGEIKYKDPTYFIIEVAGIGYEVKISLNTYTRFKEMQKCKIFTYLHVKEDAHTLYGFYNEDEKWMFSQLITISGIGPGTAIMMLSSMNVSEIREAIVREDAGMIKSVKGIGLKTAERVILELKDKFKKEITGDKILEPVADHMKAIREESLAALVTLGFQKAAAEKSINSILKNASEDITLEDVIKLALKNS